MVAYNFQPAFQAAIRDGSKDLTFRRIGVAKHARPGDRIPLLFPQGPGKKAAGVTALCVLRAQVMITGAGVLRIVGPVLTFNDHGAGLARLLEACEQAMPQAAEHLPRLAAHDGFADWPALWTWQRDNARDDESAHELARIVIGWNPATIEERA
ncbi:hypothetical protein [Caulobacter hibisci]|uniref:ASCH domain-containing protein n=1 Tax=Caulobacter hibisci TaxID=2035993 RepID=A0ABS0SXR2_9CAUL|nr:hypothetical protein [Caulobacter hibisci]MBI1684430.1 hypothetical protein [Caulobacter hibisci]